LDLERDLGWRSRYAMKIHVHSIMYRRSDLIWVYSSMYANCQSKQSKAGSLYIPIQSMQSMQFVVNTISSTPTPC
jgi:hypothetical protein